MAPAPFPAREVLERLQDGHTSVLPGYCPESFAHVLTRTSQLWAGRWYFMEGFAAIQLGQCSRLCQGFPLHPGRDVFPGRYSSASVRVAGSQCLVVFEHGREGFEVLPMPGGLHAGRDR